MFAATVTTGAEVGACIEDNNGCTDDCGMIDVVRGDATGASLDDGDDCTDESEVAVKCVVGTAKILFPATGMDVVLTAEVALALEVALAATVMKLEW